MLSSGIQEPRDARDSYRGARPRPQAWCHSPGEVAMTPMFWFGMSFALALWALFFLLLRWLM
jgi:hypothetical protein